MYSFTVVSLDDRLNKINVTIPYSAEHLPARSEFADNPEVMTTSTMPLSRRLYPLGDNATVLEIDLPGSLPGGDGLALIVRYNLAGTVTGAEQTFWDGIFARTGNLGAIFRAYRHDDSGDRTRVEFLFPRGWVVKRWEPKHAVKKYDDHRDTISLEWSLAGKGDQINEFYAIYGEARITQRMFLVISGVIICVVLIAGYFSLWIRRHPGFNMSPLHQD
jgi:hypothetical protein